MEKLDYLDYGEEADDIWELNQMEWLSPKRLAELKEEHKRNPPSQEEEEKSASVLELTHGRSGETAQEKVREINGHRYTYVQPDAVDYTAPVRTAANYAKQRYGLDIDVSDGPTYVDGREHNDLMLTK